MRIVHVYKDYSPILGGIENHIKTLAEAQAARGHEVTVLVTQPGGLPAREVMNGVQVIRAARLVTAASTPLSAALPWHLARLRPDMTHLHFPYPVGEVSQLLVGRKRPFVISYHSDVVKQQAILRLYRPVLWRVLKRADHLIAGSPNYVQSSPYLRPFAHKCTVVSYAVDPGRFQNQTPLIPPNTLPTILFVGRHRYYKGVDDLLQAMVHVPARLLVAGDGPMRKAWERVTAVFGITERVHFLGDVADSQLPALYASADIFVLPANARSEAFGKVLLEAMAAGLPCVTTELGTGTSFVVRHEESGLVVPPGNPTALAEALNRLVAQPELRQRMGQAGRQRVQAQFTPEKMVDGVMAVYDRVTR